MEHIKMWKSNNLTLLLPLRPKEKPAGQGKGTQVPDGEGSRRTDLPDDHGWLPSAAEGKGRASGSAPRSLVCPRELGGRGRPASFWAWLGVPPHRKAGVTGVDNGLTQAGGMKTSHWFIHLFISMLSMHSLVVSCKRKESYHETRRSFKGKQAQTSVARRRLGSAVTEPRYKAGLA